MPMKPITIVRRQFEREFNRQAAAGWETPEIERAATRLRCALWERAHNKTVHPSSAKDLTENMRALTRARNRDRQ